MSGHGGKRAGAGRKEGGKNKRQTKVTEAIEKQLTKDWATEPLDVMKEAIDEPKPQRKDFDDAAEFLAAYILWFKTRFEAAKAAAPYRHARIAVSKQGGNLPEHERYLIEDRRDG